MRTLGISDFKTHCIQLLKEAHRLREPLIVTRRGKPLVRIEPIPGPEEKRKLGALQSKLTVQGDLVETDFAEDWELGP